MNPGAISLVFGGPACVARAEAAGAISARRAFPEGRPPTLAHGRQVLGGWRAPEPPPG